MSQRSNGEIVRAAYGAYLARQRQAFEDLLADDFTFTSPYDDAIGKAAYFEICWPNHERLVSFDIEKICEDGDEAVVLYRIARQDGKSFRNTEWMRFASGKIRNVTVFFGPSYQHGRFIKAAA